MVEDRRLRRCDAKQRSRSSVSHARSVGVNEATPWWNGAGGPRSFHGMRTPSRSQLSTCRDAPMRRHSSSPLGLSPWPLKRVHTKRIALQWNPAVY